MLVGDLNLNLLIKENTPASALLLYMENDCKRVKVEAGVHDVEEGEISDSASVEEISEEDFNITQALQPPVPPPPPPPKSASSPNNVTAVNNSSGGGSGPRVWAVRDLYKYQISANTSYSGLYNLAWAQAVVNKPLGDVFVMMGDASDDNNNSSSAITSNRSDDNDNVKVVIDVEDDGEKEEGELEEGEIDLDSDDKVLDVDSNKEEAECQVKDDDLDRRKRVDLVMEELVNLNAADAQK